MESVIPNMEKGEENYKVPNLEKGIAVLEYLSLHPQVRRCRILRVSWISPRLLLTVF